MSKKKGSRAARPGRIAYETTLTRDEAADYLEDIARGLRQGSVVFDAGTHELALGVGSDVELDLQARRGKGKARVKLGLRFRQPAKAAEDTNGASATASEADAASVAPAATLPDEFSF